MSISWIRCLPLKSKNNYDMLSIKSDEIKKVLNDSILANRPKGKRIDNHTDSDDKYFTLSKGNTISDINLSNVFDPNPEMVRSSSFLWPEVDMTHTGCTGHECLKKSDEINRVIIYQKFRRKMKDQFTPPFFQKTGIAVCPEPLPFEEKVAEIPDIQKHHSSVLEDDIYYKTPGNMEFIDFTYPIIHHKWRYTTYAVPNNRNDWEWIYNYIRSIQNSFRRKYLCDVLLSSEPGKYKGHVTYLVRLEADDQAHILRCRSGLPRCLRDILLIPTNAYYDIECFVSEYLIKRKNVFGTLHDLHRNDQSEFNKPVLQIKNNVSESYRDDTNQPTFKTKTESVTASENQYADTMKFKPPPGPMP